LYIIRSRAPCRISFGGGGTDVPAYIQYKDGAVLSAAINIYAYATLKPLENLIRLGSPLHSKSCEAKCAEELVYDGSFDLAKAAIKFLKPAGFFELSYFCEAPSGSGLGTSSAEAVAVIGALKEFTGAKDLDEYSVAELAYRVEREELGQKGGYQDQYASAFGGFNFMEFRKNGVFVQPLRIKSDFVAELKACSVLCCIPGSRLSGEIHSRIDYKLRGSDPKLIESLDKLREIAYEMRDALVKGDIRSMAEMLDRSWQYKRRLDKEVATPLIDRIYNNARSRGALGGKLLGAGGSGHMFLICDFRKKFDVVKELEEDGCKVVNYDFESEGLKVWRVKEMGQL
jgi:D-glycero-alpha-D-manno-heptose-7-phosphate kinase